MKFSVTETFYLHVVKNMLKPLLSKLLYEGKFFILCKVSKSKNRFFPVMNKITFAKSSKYKNNFYDTIIIMISPHNVISPRGSINLTFIILLNDLLNRRNSIRLSRAS